MSAEEHRLMKTSYTVIRVGDVPLESGEIDWPPEPGIKLIHGLIDPILGAGEPLEHVSVLHDGRPADMFVSELGHRALTTRGPLPINGRATIIYRHYWMTRFPETDAKGLPTIAGTAILFSRRVWF
jgi:hypothetical protein